MVGIVEQVGADVESVKPGDRVTVNVETFCGKCFFCRRGYVNNCTDPNGGWALGCRIDGGQAEYVRVPYADQGLNRIPDTVSDEQALLVGDVLATGYWAAQISEIKPQGYGADYRRSGKSGMLCCYEARKRVGVTGKVIGLCYSPEEKERLDKLGFCHEVVCMELVSRFRYSKRLRS